MNSSDQLLTANSLKAAAGVQTLIAAGDYMWQYGQNVTDTYGPMIWDAGTYTATTVVPFVWDVGYSATSTTVRCVWTLGRDTITAGGSAVTTQLPRLIAEIMDVVGHFAMTSRMERFINHTKSIIESLVVLYDFLHMVLAQMTNDSFAHGVLTVSILFILAWTLNLISSIVNLVWKLLCIIGKLIRGALRFLKMIVGL